MPYIVCRKPSGVHFVVTVGSKDEAILYEVAIRRLFEFDDEAKLECRRLEKERRKRHKKLKASQQKLFADARQDSVNYM